MVIDRPPTIPNWLLITVADLDIKFQPGLLAQIVRSSPHRRHVVATILAVSFPDREQGYPPEAFELAAELAAGRLATLLENWLPSSPQGSLGVLGRMHENIEIPDFYRKLYQTYSDPDRRDVVRALRHIRNLNARMLDVVIDAAPILLRSGGWQLVRSRQQRDDLLAALSTIQEISGATDAEISRSLTSALAHGSVTKFITGWLSRSRFPAPPDIGHPMIQPILSAAELHQTSLEFENCLNGFLLDAVCGKEAFYVAESPVFGRMVVRIAHEDLDSAWELLGVHLKRNRTPSFAATEWVRGEFADAGIRHQGLRRSRGEKFAAIERLLDPVILDLDEMMAEWVP